MDHNTIPAECTQLHSLPIDTGMINRYVSSVLELQHPRPKSHKLVQLANVARMEHRAIQTSAEDLSNFVSNVQAQYEMEVEKVHQKLAERVNFLNYEFQRQVAEVQRYYEDRVKERVAAKERELQQHFEQKLDEQRKADQQLHYFQQLDTNQRTVESSQDVKTVQDEMKRMHAHYQQHISEVERAREDDYSQYTTHITKLEQQLEIKNHSIKNQFMVYQRKLQELQKQKNTFYHEYAVNCSHHKVLIAMNAKMIIPKTPEEQLLKETMEEVQEILDNYTSKNAEIARLNAELLDRQDARCKYIKVDNMKAQLFAKDRIIDNLREELGLNGRGVEDLVEQFEMSNRNFNDAEEQLKIKDRELKSFQVVLNIKDDQFVELENEKEELRKKLEEKELQIQNMGMHSPDTAINALDSDGDGVARS